MHMMLSDTVVLSDDAYRISDVMNDVTNSYYPLQTRLFFPTFTFSYFIAFFLLLRVFDQSRLAVNAPGPAPRGAFRGRATPNHCLSPPKRE